MHFNFSSTLFNLFPNSFCTNSFPAYLLIKNAKDELRNIDIRLYKNPQYGPNSVPAIIIKIVTGKITKNVLIVNIKINIIAANLNGFYQVVHPIT